MKNSPESGRGRGRGWTVLRAATLAFMLFCAGVFALSSVHFQNFAAQNPGAFAVWEWTIEEMNIILGQTGLSFNDWITWNFITGLLLAILCGGLAAFLFFRQAAGVFGLYLSAAFMMFGTLSGHTTSILTDIYPELTAILIILGVLPWLFILMLFYLFPNGKFVPGWTRWVAAALLVSFGIDILVYGGRQPPPFLLLPMMLCIALAPVSQFIRYRRVSNAIERQQTKWVLFTMLVVIVVLLFGIGSLLFAGEVDPASPFALGLTILSSLSALLFGMIPLSIAVAVLRYRLWDIDLIIRRTLQYGFLSGVLALVYFGGIVVMQGVAGALFGQSGSPLATVVTTLGIAALFNPLRIRIQLFIDRRFYRVRYNAQHTLSRFAGAARDEVDLDKLIAELLGAVEEAMHPERVELLLKAGR